MIAIRWILITPLLIALLILPSCPACAQERPHDGENPAEREAAFQAARAYPFGRIPQAARLDAVLYSRSKMKRFAGDGAAGLANEWRAIGPFDMGGRITSIALHPSDGKTLWVGAADGGVWKSTDRGASWKPVMDFESAIAMGVVAVDPSNPSVLYAGTGEAAMNVDTYGGGGMMKSTDGGATWHGSGLTSVAAFSRVVVSPSNPNIVLAAAVRNNAGLYRSSDAGRTWARIVAHGVTDITINPANPSEIWIGGGPDAVMRSADAGLTFAPSGAGIGVDGAGIARVSVQVAPSAPAVLYALVHEIAFPQGSASRIYKSTDGGANWRLILDNDPDILGYYGNAQGDYNNVIAVKPDDPNVVIAGGVVLARSMDGGATWEVIDTELHLDHHALAFDPVDPDRLYVGNDGGVYVSQDAGQTFDRITSGLAITQFYAMAIDQSRPDRTYGGTQDNGTITNEAAEYVPGGPGVVGGGDGFAVVVDPADPNIVYYEQPHGLIFRRDLAAGTYAPFTDGIALGDQNDRAAWSAPFIGDPGNPDRFYCGRRRVYRRARGTSWKALSPRFRTPISALAVSPVKPDIIYAASGTDAGGSILISDGVPLGELKVSTDGGATWADRSSTTGLPNRVATDIVASPRDSCTAYIAFSGFLSGHIFRTTDCGAAWTDVGKGLPDIPVNALAIDPADPAIIYAGTDIGMFITTDGGGVWADYNQGLPNAVVVDLAIHAASRTLRLATHGRSMWEIPLASPAPSAAITAPSGREVWMARTRQTLAWSGLTGPVRLEYSTDDGASWNPIAEGVTASAYAWAVPDAPAGGARIRATETAGAGRSLTSRAFTIGPFRTGAVLTSTLKAFPCWGLAYDGERLWATVENSDTLLVLDPQSLATIGIVKVDYGAGRHRFTGLAYHPGRKTFFIHDITDAKLDGTGQAWLLEVARDGAVVNTWLSPCVYPTGLAWLGDGAGGSLIASDMSGAQDLYLIDPATGATTRTIHRATTIAFGPAGIASAGDGTGFWQVIDDFDIDTGPHGSSVVRSSIDDLSARCSFELLATPDSALAGGYTGWGKLFARGVERDPADGTLWVTNLDGSIYKYSVCEAGPASTPVVAAPTLDAALDPIAPNPMTGPAALGFTLSRSSRVTLGVYDELGRIVALLADGRFDAGRHAVRFNPAGLASGIYHCRLDADGATTVSSVVVYVR